MDYDDDDGENKYESKDQNEMTQLSAFQSDMEFN